MCRNGVQLQEGDAVADKQSGKATFFLLPLALGCIFSPSPLFIFFDMVGIVWCRERGSGGGDQLQCFDRHCVLTYFVMRFPRLHLPNGRLFGVSNRTFTFRFKFNSVSGKQRERRSGKDREREAEG